jgi:hypothetical protein
LGCNHYSMSVWYCAPSIRPIDQAEPVLSLWQDMGYKLAILRQGCTVPADILVYTNRYMGMPQSINTLTHYVLGQDSEAEWLVLGNDDIEPDPNHTPDLIARECGLHFGMGYGCISTFGVMQPTGDRWNEGSIDRAAASAWMGREWCRTMYGGTGPMCNEYTHYYCDTELQEVAEYRGVFWQRRDLVQAHKHWTREGKPTPGHMKEIYTGLVLQADKETYERRKRAVFPGHAPKD